MTKKDEKVVDFERETRTRVSSGRRRSETRNPGSGSKGNLRGAGTPRARFDTSRLAISVAMAALVTLFVYQMRSYPWSLSTNLRHVLSRPNCTAARLMGVAPARRGEPGYYPHHDADHDGIACEPYYPHHPRTPRYREGPDPGLPRVIRND